ncbi:hypothetical protein [Herbidospora daliensis]|uniref:hypothetical protein n=1 Tax=Herbidospora daliensis TaxID=295585 RepID=UPI00078607CB|nr:hypothetical protein [Herbidospora daliensis]
MTRARALVALVCVLAALVVAQALIARAKVAGLRDTIEVYEAKGAVSASTLAGARLRAKVVAGLANTRCDGLPECAQANPVTVEPCDGGLCVSHAWSGREQVAGGEAAGAAEVAGCEGARWRFTFEPARAAFDPEAGLWFVTAFDARLRLSSPKGGCAAVWEATGARV